MSKHGITRVNWSGRASVAEARALLEEYDRVELELPPDMHHTLFVHLNPDARPARLEQLDVDGGPDLLQRVAEIDVLAPIADLASAGDGGRLEINLSSPAPLLRVRRVRDRPQA